MAKKLTISIPDDLAEDLNPWRDRMNISKVCAGAIRAELRVLADLPAMHQDLGEVNYSGLVARLRAEKKGMQDRDYQTGYADGYNLVDGQSYQDFLYYEGLVAQRRPISYNALLEDHRDDISDYFAEGLIVDGDTYAQGFVDGLMAVWARIKDKV